MSQEEKITKVLQYFKKLNVNDDFLMPPTLQPFMLNDTRIQQLIVKGLEMERKDKLRAFTLRTLVKFGQSEDVSESKFIDGIFNSLVSLVGNKSLEVAVKAMECCVAFVNPERYQASVQIMEEVYSSKRNTVAEWRILELALQYAVKSKSLFELMKSSWLDKLLACACNVGGDILDQLSALEIVMIGIKSKWVAEYYTRGEFLERLFGLLDKEMSCASIMRFVSELVAVSAEGLEKCINIGFSDYAVQLIKFAGSESKSSLNRDTEVSDTELDIALSFIEGCWHCGNAGLVTASDWCILRDVISLIFDNNDYYQMRACHSVTDILKVCTLPGLNVDVQSKLLGEVNKGISSEKLIPRLMHLSQSPVMQIRTNAWEVLRQLPECKSLVEGFLSHPGLVSFLTDEQGGVQDALAVASKLAVMKKLVANEKETTLAFLGQAQFDRMVQSLARASNPNLNKQHKMKDPELESGA